MGVESRYTGFDRLPQETARAGSERRTDAMIALQSTTRALEEIREQLRKEKKAAKRAARPKGQTARDRFIAAFQPPETKKVGLGNTVRVLIPEGLFFNPVGERLEFRPESALTIPEGKSSGWLVARLDELDADIREILDPEGKHTFICVSYRLSIGYCYQHILRKKKTGSWD